jgi:hypothetical protein
VHGMRRGTHRIRLLWSEDVLPTTRHRPFRRAKMQLEQEIVRCELNISRVGRWERSGKPPGVSHKVLR